MKYLAIIETHSTFDEFQSHFTEYFGVTRAIQSGIPMGAEVYFKDGDQWARVAPDFINQQVSKIAFGSTREEANANFEVRLSADVVKALAHGLRRVPVNEQAEWLQDFNPEFTSDQINQILEEV